MVFDLLMESLIVADEETVGVSEAEKVGDPEWVAPVCVGVVGSVSVADALKVGLSDELGDNEMDGLNVAVAVGVSGGVMVEVSVRDIVLDVEGEAVND